MILPLVDIFSQPYEAWTSRTPSIEEATDIYKRTGVMSLHVNDQLIARVANAFDAATYIAMAGMDNGLGNHINNTLDHDKNYALWSRSMPSTTPPGLKKYKSSYPAYDVAQVYSEIESHGALLSSGQMLFHAGVWPSGASLVTDRPLSTSFCPQVALMNAVHKGKAYDANRIDIFVVHVVAPTTKAFVYKRKRLNHGHENEVVFSAGASMTLISRTQVRDDYNVSKAWCPSKQVPVYVLEIDLS